MFNSWGLVIGYGTFASYYPGYPLKGKDQLQPNLIGSTQSGYWTGDGLFFSLSALKCYLPGSYRKGLAIGVVADRALVSVT